LSPFSEASIGTLHTEHYPAGLVCRTWGRFSSPASSESPTINKSRHVLGSNMPSSTPGNRMPNKLSLGIMFSAAEDARENIAFALKKVTITVLALQPFL